MHLAPAAARTLPDAFDLTRDASSDLLIRAATAQDLHVGHDRAERVADFMRHAGREPADTGELFRAHELALRIEQAIGHPIQAFSKRGEVAGGSVGRPRAEVAVGDGIRRLHYAIQRTEDQAGNERVPVEDEDADLESDQDDNERHAAIGRDGEREQGRRHADEKRERDQKGEIEEQLGTQCRFGDPRPHQGLSLHQARTVSRNVRNIGDPWSSRHIIASSTVADVSCKGTSATSDRFTGSSVAGTSDTP